MSVTVVLFEAPREVFGTFGEAARHVRTTVRDAAFRSLAGDVRSDADLARARSARVVAPDGRVCGVVQYMTPLDTFERLIMATSGAASQAKVDALSACRAAMLEAAEGSPAFARAAVGAERAILAWAGLS